MSALTEVAEALGEKDDAITDMIYWLKQHQEECDAKHADQSVNCDVGYHYFLCKSEIAPLIEKLQKAFKAR